jgi:predicted HAD superfamily Cof-like phosphohydrolase
MFKMIVDWNNKRGIIERGFDHTKEASFIIEELLESTGKYDSLSAREKAVEYAKEIIGETDTEPEKIIDAMADIIVFATGAIAKNGYDPAKVMDEVYKQINSRTGSMVDGKFVKDNDAVIYQADFTKCLMVEEGGIGSKSK